MTMTYARQSSPYVYIPEQFSNQVYSRINKVRCWWPMWVTNTTDGFATLDWSGGFLTRSSTPDG